MAKRKKKLKITPVLVTLNILVLFVIVIFYTTRLIVYYNKENKSTNNDNLLVDNVIKKRSYVDLNNGLIYDENNNTYTYKGDAKDNYLEYSNILFRILSVDENNNIKLVTDDIVTTIYGNIMEGFEGSNINTWLNKSDNEYSGIFESNLYNSDILLNSSLCIDKVDDLTNIKCEEVYDSSKITTLSLNDYYESGGTGGFLNINKSFYLNTLNSKNSHYFVTDSGDIGINNVNSKSFGVRAVITIPGNTKVISGKGSEYSPYKIEEHDIKKLSDLYVGNIISFSNSLYKVINISDTKVKVSSIDIIKSEDKEVVMSYGTNNTYSTKKDTLGYYLNNTYYNSLKGNKYIIKSSWPTGSINTLTLDYSSIYSSSVSANIGLLSLGDMYVNEVKNVFLINRGIGDDKMIDVVSKDGNIFGDLVTSEYNIRPAFYLDATLSIKSGDGTTASPYVVGELNEEE